MDRSVKTFGNDYFKNSFFNDKVKPKKVVYNKNHLQMGRIVRNGRVTDEIYAIPIKESFRFIIIGANRSGKSYLLRSFSDRYYLLGNKILNLNDAKNETVSSLEPVQEKFRQFLLPGETPRGFKMLVLRPTFFKQIDTFLDKYNYWYSVDGRKITRADFMTLINATKMNNNQQTALEIIYEQIMIRLKKDKDLELTVDLINEIIDEEDIAPATQRSLRFRFRPIASSYFFDKENVKNIVDAIKNGYIPSINVKNFDMFGEGSVQYTETLLGMVFREVRTACRSNKIKRMMVVFDEASRFIGNRRNTSIKDEMLSSSELDAASGVDLVTVWQSVDDIPPTIHKQSKYVFIPNTADVRTIQQLLLDTGLTNNQQRSMNDAIKWKNKMKKIPYVWGVIDKNNFTFTLMVPLAPLSNHKETEN